MPFIWGPLTRADSTRRRVRTGSGTIAAATSTEQHTKAAAAAPSVMSGNRSRTHAEIPDRGNVAVAKPTAEDFGDSVRSQTIKLICSDAASGCKSAMVTAQ